MKNLFTILLTLIVSIGLYANNKTLREARINPMFPNRMANYFISEYSSNFDAVDFNLAANSSKWY